MLSGAALLTDVPLAVTVITPVAAPEGITNVKVVLMALLTGAAMEPPPSWDNA